MNTGKLNRRISYTPFGTFIDDGFGGKIQTDTGTVFETWCSARQLSMRELISYGLPINIRTFEFGFIYDRGVNIKNGMMLTYGLNQFRTVQVNEINEAKREIKIIATNQ